MDTVVDMRVVTAQDEAEVTRQMDRAFEAFRFVEQVCSRFDEQSEVMRLSAQVGVPVPVSALLFEAIRFAVAMAADTDGAFDPAVGRRLESYGFNRHYLSGQTHDSGFDPTAPVSYRDILLDESARTVCLQKPLIVDLGAVAKGLAVDLAAKELADCEGFVIDAGGDLYAHGLNEQGEPWKVGIRHPLRRDETIGSFRVSGAAVCTSGSYERPSPVRADIHHLIDPRSGASRRDLLSSTVVAPFAMLADAAATAVYILGPAQGVAYLERSELDGLLIDSSLKKYMTKVMAERVVDHEEREDAVRTRAGVFSYA